MADIATISLRADTSSLEQGDKALDHFGQTAEKATKQADGLNDAFKAGAQSQKQNNESLKQQQQALQDLLAKINPVNNALNKLDDMQLQLSKFRSQGIVDDRTYRESAVAIGRARQELTAAAEAIAKRLNFDYTIWTENKISVSQPLSLFLLFAFCLCPFMLNWVKIWRICRQILHHIPCIDDDLLNIMFFVKSCIVHHDYTVFREYWDKDLCDPGIENIAVNIDIK